MAEVSVNQTIFQFPDSGKLADVLPMLGVTQSDGIAIAVNDDVIPRGDWEHFELHDRDQVFVIRATQGG